jgi:hypothetical protein
MQTYKILLATTLLALATLACGFDVDLPITTDIKTGPTVTDDIQVPFFGDPNAPADLTLAFGAGELYLSPGAEDSVLSGEATYNIEDMKPEISIQDGVIEIKTGNLEIDGIPNFTESVENTWDFNLGAMPMDLSIRAGAYVADFELGGLSITSLHVSDGASEVVMEFDEPNLVEMKTLRYETGASDITLRNLANANFNTLIFESGAGKYELDFSGQLQRDADVFIETGLSTMTLVVPEDMNVKLSIEGGLTNVSSRGAWDQSGSIYTIEGSGPLLTITLEMNAGNLILTNP